MANAPTKKVAVTETQILDVTRGEMTVHIISDSPLIFNRMSEKAKRTLLMGGGRKNAAEFAANLKHDPEAEYRASVYRNRGDNAPTRLCFPSPAMKGTMRTAALDMPGSTKTEIGRRVWMPGYSIDIYGIPKLLMSVVRSADIKKTPDIRTRAIVEAWCCEVTIRYAQPLVTEKQIVGLFAAGGILCGIGDWRQEKGSGSFGQFRLCSPQDADYRRIVATGGRQAQDRALQHIECFDAESAELLQFYTEEVIRRGREKKEPRKPAAFVVARDANGKGKRLPA